MINDINRAQFLPGGDYAVLALHGLRSTPLELQPLLKALHRAGFTVDAPHLPDYGFSANDCTGSWRDWLDVVPLALKTSVSIINLPQTSRRPWKSHLT